MRYNHSIQTFASGELSPELHGRTDLKQYGSGLKEVTNFNINKSGGAFRRNGVEWMGTITDALATSIDFITYVAPSAFGEVIIIVYETGDTTLDKYMNNITIVSLATGGPPNIVPTFTPNTRNHIYTGVENLGVISTVRDLRFIQLGLETYIIDSTGATPPFKILADTVTAIIGDIESETVAIPVPFSASTLDDVKSIVKSNPISNIDGVGKVWFDDAPSNNGFLRAPLASTMRIADAFFRNGVVGSVIYARDTAAVLDVVFVVTAFVNPFEVTGFLLTGNTALISEATATSTWNYGSFGAYTGFPTVQGFFQNRLHYASTTLEPLTLWTSDIEDFSVLMNQRLTQDGTTNFSGLNRFGPSILDEAFSKKIIATGKTKITSMGLNSRFLYVGTTEGDFQISFATTSSIEGYAASTITIQKNSEQPSAIETPIYADTKLVYISRSRKELHSIDILSDSAEYKNQNISILSDKMWSNDRGISGGFRYGVFVEDSDVVWAVTLNNELVAVTMSSDTGVIAWSRFQISSEFTGELVSISSLSGDKLSLAFKLGTDIVLGIISTEEANPALPNTLAYPYYPKMDFWLASDWSSGDTITSLVLPAPHLANKQVLVLTEDGDSFTATTDGAGNFPIPVEYQDADTAFSVGLAFKSKLESLVPNQGQQFGDARGNTQRIDRITLSLYNSQKGLFGQDSSDLNDIEYEDSELFTGDITLDMSQDSGREPRFIVETESAFPLNLVSATIRGVSYDG